ncbi:serine/threonine-protein kinase Nek8-like [Halichondria panicea]|uniref:serine/threonine-protein kinase Nek8-like n=1 Tax=Halichondria panicea TaxID=6063 RepID=UPI00312B616D
MERYEQIRVIGQGAFGKVYLVTRKSDGKHVVTKEIPIDDLPKVERQSALNEVKVLKLLKHPNIVAHYDNFVADKSLVIVMEYAPGGTLHEFIQDRNGTLMEEDHVLQFFAQLLVAIDHVHSLNILHRDLKTQNVMMNRSRSVLKIGDFGISKVLSSKITSAQTVVGTPCYISPEICEGKMYAKKSDIWALGCILYEMTTLKKAFEGPNLPVLVLKIMQASAALVPIDSSYSQRLDKLIHHLLQKKPENRPSIHSVMATPVVVNALLNLCTDVGRLPCARHSQTSVEIVREASGEGGPPHQVYRMGSLGKYRQRSFFQDDSQTQGQDTQTKAVAKSVVYLWGGGSTVPMKLSVPNMLTDSGIVSVACGRSQRAGATEDGKLIFWELVSGSLATTRFSMTQSRGPRGAGRGPLVFEPRLIGGLKTTVIKKVACGDMFTACLTDKGILMTFGSGINGCLGHGDTNDVSEPRLVHEMLAHETVEIACGANHMLAITSEGGLYSWGKGDKGQLGLGADCDQHSPRKVQVPVESPPARACCGVDCSLVITESGQLLAAGNNRHNKLTLDHIDISSEEDSKTLTNPPSPPHTSTSTLTSQPPTTVDLPSDPVTHRPDHMTSQGSGNVPVILNLIKDRPGAMAGSFYLSNLRAMKGNNKEDTSSPPALPVASAPGSVRSSSVFTLSGSELINSESIVSVAMGTNHIAIITAGTECLTCGDNSYGQLGYHRDKELVTSGGNKPSAVEVLTGKQMELVSCGDFYTIVSCRGGEVYSWGSGRRGRLGRDASEDVFQPQLIPFEHLSHSVQAVNSAHSVTLLVTRPDS